jgi:hypothetical protein
MLAVEGEDLWVAIRAQLELERALEMAASIPVARGNPEEKTAGPDQGSHIDGDYYNHVGLRRSHYGGQTLASCCGAPG